MELGFGSGVKKQRQSGASGVIFDASAAKPRATSFIPRERPYYFKYQFFRSSLRAKA